MILLIRSSMAINYQYTPKNDLYEIYERLHSMDKKIK